MDTASKNHSRLLSLASCFIILVLASGSLTTAQPFKLFGVSDLSTIFEDGFRLPPTNDTIIIFGIRGEIISGQFVILAFNNLSNVTVTVSSFKNQVTGNTFPVENVAWNFVGAIPLTINAPNQPKEALTRVAPARFPDYLMTERQINVRKGVHQPVWLTITIPENAEQGTYSGTAVVRNLQIEKSIPVCLIIYPFSLPSERHLKITEWFNTRWFEKLHGIQGEYSDDWFAMLRKYADNMVAHRQNVFEVSMRSIVISKLKTGELEFDYSLFDKIVQIFLDTKKMDFIETGFITKFGEGDWNSTQILLQDFNVKDQETGENIVVPGKEVIPFLLPAFEDHLRQKGWLDKTLFHIKDEPSVFNAISYHDISALIHKYIPDLKRIDAIETSYVSDYLEVAVPQIDHLATWYDDFLKAAKNGMELWIYSVGIYQATSFPNKTIDVPVIDNRIMHWVNYKYDLTGYLHWGWNQWTENPYQEVGEHIGDGWHVYPVKGGVLNSLRWEQMRNGIQDYEYLHLLEEKICVLKDSLGSVFSWIDPKRRSKEIAGRIVQSLANQTNDPEILYDAKMEIINELIDFDKSQGLYVQVNPEENTLLKNGSTVEIFGWAERGTRIFINDDELPVSNQGLFLGISDLTSIRHSIKVKAVKDNKTKEITRNFVVEY